LGTVAGALLGYHLLEPQKHGVADAFAVGGMFTGTYIGGSVNLNAVALQYGVTKSGTLFAAINAADNIVTTIWIVVTMLLPRFLQRRWPRKIPSGAANPATAGATANLETHEPVRVTDLALLLALGLGSLFVSQAISAWLPSVPYVLTLTTVALLLAQLPLIQKLRGARLLGYFTVLLFLAVVGAYCDIPALLANGSVALTLLAWGAIIIGIHGLIIFGLGALFRQDWATISIASNANIGGATTAGVLATAIGRDDLRLPGILAGSLGNALGTYAGLLVAVWLR
ncbi:MAG: DUF819 family protein, partial [Verrucomicrobiota bacterium]|nr:DUF819 family protein [Verrucomicrobiota bacterium]